MKSLTPIDQEEGQERYFFENVRHGIRTTEDGAIWKRSQQYRPRWLEGGAYAEAVALLVAELPRASNGS